MLSGGAPSPKVGIPPKGEPPLGTYGLAVTGLPGASRHLATVDPDAPALEVHASVESRGVLEPVLVLHLAHRGGVRRKVLLHRHHVQLRTGERREVELGAGSSTHAEVLKGLTGGEILQVAR